MRQKGGRVTSPIVPFLGSSTFMPGAYLWDYRITPWKIPGQESLKTPGRTAEEKV